MKINQIKSKIPHSHQFQVVGIGASAGGLEAFKRFIKAIPQNSGMAYVLVQHLDPGHESLLPFLVQKITTIPVLEILEDIKVKPDHIYVIPNNKMIIAGDGILKLIPRFSNNKHGNLPIDAFFTSLGEVYKSNAIGVVLSGNGSDGTAGLRAIRDCQGITFSQDKDSAAYKGMPDSAAQSGVVDFILPPEDIPQKILELTKSLNLNNVKNKNIVRQHNTFLTGVETNTRFNISQTAQVINTQTPDFQKMADHILLSKFSPTGIVVTGEMEIVYFRGHTADYLELAPGKPSFNLLKMAKEGLAFELLNILNKVKKENAPVVTENFPMLTNGKKVYIDIEAIPLPNMIDAHYLILFHDKIATVNHRITGSNKNITAKKKIDKDFDRIKHLEQEMIQKREEMRIITEDLESANEKLQNANEELQSGSEELQSLNDELEASKENLQNNNEVLTSLNQELIGLNEQVTSERNYTESIIDTVWEPLLVLDKNFRIKSANSSFYKKFRVNKKQTDGTLVYDLGNKQWDIPKLHILLEEILPQKTRFTDFKMTQIFTGVGERVMQLNACEIIREKKEEKLILLSIQDITEKEKLQIKEKEFQRELEEKVNRRTFELQEANEELQQKNQEIALSKYNKRFITEFSEKFSAYTTDNEFFNSLVQFIGDTTRLDYVFVGIPGHADNKEPVVQTIALSAFGKLIENINYSFEGSPCEQVMLGTDCSFPKNCRQSFPKSKILRRFKVEGYLGYPLKDDHGNSVGFIAVMHEKNIKDTETVSAVLKIVARRAEIELERIKHGKELEFQNAEKEKRSAELITANKELVFQNHEKEKRAAELIIANRELAFQNEEKEKRASELIIANKELAFQNEEKERRAVELNIANKELESFAYVSSHDLQEPLRKIQTFANRILEKEYAVLSDKGKDYFNRMHSASKRMRTLIEDLLAFSRANITEQKFEKTDLNNIIAEVKNEFAETLLEKNAIIDADKMDEAVINPFQFLQVMNNLVGNALKFSNAGSPLYIKIKSEIAKGIHFQNENPAIQAGRLSPKKYYCHIAVTDNGIGFDPKYKDKIFEVFQRLHGSEEYEGTGIGLAIVKKIIEHHNGIITASSEIGKGSTFDIYVPA